MTDGPAARRPWYPILAWAAYLACSWTWCIGMFLPVLLVRDYGIWGFVVFAVPNVVGAAAMGWVVTSPEASARIVARHGLAMRAFAAVTALFHLWFIAWFARAGGWAPATGFLIGLVIAIAPTFRIGWGGVTAIRDAAPIMWLASLIAIGIAAAALPAPSIPPPSSHEPLLYLAPVCIFGFALCPYLDASFHRARRAITEDRDARYAFGLGFGVFFLVMVLGTVLYSGLFGGVDPMRVTFAGLPLAAVFAHVTLQSVYTCRTLGEAISAQVGAPLTGRAYLPMVSVLIVVVALLSYLTRRVVYHDLALGEFGYRLFMAFYGLVFPTYVWLCMIPTRDGHSGIEGPRGRRKLFISTAAVVLAAPAFWMGFIEGREWWLAPGLGIVLLARLILPRHAIPGDGQAASAPPPPSAGPSPSPQGPPRSPSPAP